MARYSADAESYRALNKSTLQYHLVIVRTHILAISDRHGLRSFLAGLFYRSWHGISVGGYSSPKLVPCSKFLGVYVHTSVLSGWNDECGVRSLEEVIALKTRDNRL